MSDWPKEMDIVEVAWADSHATGGWRSEEQWKQDRTETMECRSAGYLLYEDSERLVLVQSKSSLGSMADSLSIPKAVVRSVQRFKEA